MGRLRTGAVALAVVGLVAAGGAPASATHNSTPRHFGHGAAWHPTKFTPHHKPVAGATTVVASGLAGPLTFGVDGRQLYVGQAFAGIVSKLVPGDDPLVVGTAAAGADAAAVDVAPGVLTWGERVGGEGEPPSVSVLHRQTRDGVQDVDVLAYETSANPDKNTTYGFRDLSDACAAQVPAMFQSYQGAIDSHVYGSVNVGDTTYLADAGANAILKVDRKGTISTVAVLPGVPVKVSADQAAAFGLPACVAGHKYWFEPVPTDIEVAGGGSFYVTLLPGGPEDGSLGDQGRLVKVNRTGKVTTVATGLAGATGVAVAGDGSVFVAELNGNRVSSVDGRGRVRTLVELNQPAGVEWANGKLYVSTDVFGAGQVVSLKVR